MKTILKKDINYYSESLDLLKLMTNDFSFEDLKNRLKRNYPLCNEYTSTVIDIISRIAAKVFSNLDFSKERLDFFFKDLNLNDLSIADILLLNQNRFLDISLEEQLTLIKNMSYKEKIYNFAQLLSSNDIAGTELKNTEIASFEELVSLISSIDTSIENKWNIQLAFLNINSLIEELSSMLNTCVLELKKYDKELSKLTKYFTDYWEPFIEQNDILHFLTSSLNYDLGSGYEEIIVCHSILNPSNISFSLDNDNIYKNVIKIGVLFNDKFTIETRVNSNHLEVYQNLKLLGDKSKFDILVSIKDTSAYGQELSEKFNLSTSTISHHMTALINARFVKVEKKNNRIYYSMNKDILENFLNEVNKLLLNSSFIFYKKIYFSLYIFS